MWLPSLSNRSGAGRRPASRKRRGLRPCLEVLENRLTPTAFAVTNLNDAGAGSLRQAVLDANSHPGADAINFRSGLKGTIRLTTGPLAVTSPTTITGPGAAALTVSGTGASRIFTVDDGDSAIAIAVKISGLTLTEGRPDGLGFGGAIFNR